MSGVHCRILPGNYPGGMTCQFIYESTEFSNHPFTGVVKRDQSLEEVLSIIEKTTNIRFKISGRTIIIKRAVDAANISRSSN